MKALAKKKLIILLIIIVAIQFIRPSHNKSSEILPTDLTKLYHVPGNVLSILRRSCYDCHSNNTNYPWYSNIQPFGLWLARHIRKGRKDLNFSDFGSYTTKQQVNKLKAVENSIKDGTMPLSSYVFMHKNARLAGSDKNAVFEWLNKIKDSISLKR